MWFSVLLIVVIGYLLGNLNGAILISRLVAHDDVRSHGSGNAGFTNFFRNYGGAVSIVVILIDGLKAAAATILGGILMARYGLSDEGSMIGALAVSLGHDFPALLGFKGGKGIVCGFAIALAYDWRIALLILVIFGGIYLITNYVSLGSILAAVSYGIGFAVWHNQHPVSMVLGICIALLAIFMHRENAKRLLKGCGSKTYFFGRKTGK